MSWTDTLAARWTRPEHPALLTADETIPYRALEARVARARGFLRAHGVQRGDGIALMLGKTPAMLELHLAALSLGVWTLPLNPSYTASEVGFFLADSDPTLAILPLKLLMELDTTVGVDLGTSAEEVAAELAQATPAPAESGVGDDVLALLCYTSGTTGRPKGAKMSHGNLAFTVQALHEAWRWGDNDVLLHTLPLFHIHGLIVAQHAALYAGATTIWMQTFDPVAALTAMERHRVTVFMGVPTLYARFLQTPPNAAPDLSAMRLFTSGSAPLPAEHHTRFLARFGHVILERYGMTEVGIVLSNPYDGPRRPGTVGFPLRGVTVRIVDAETGADQPDGQVGELWIRGAGVISGYLGLPEATAEALSGGWMRSGDLVCRDPDGYLRIVGRARDLIISGGLNVYPAEVEATLRQAEGVSEVAVIGVPDDDFGERVVALVVPSPGAAEDGAPLHALSRSLLAPYKCPKDYRFAAELPRNAMGKVQKQRIRDGWEA
jgi:malonyl-CoA/methylmalonyl-CoA synthetase